jgi:hypothetical protein
MNATKTNNNKKFTKRQMTKAERAAIVAKKKAEKEHRKQEYNKKQETTKTVSSKEAKSYFTCLDSESDADSEEKVKPMTLIHPDLLEYKYDPTRRWADMVDSSDDDDDDKMFGDNRKWDVSATTDMSSMFNESFSNNSRHR